MPPQLEPKIEMGVLLNGGKGTRTGPIGKSLAKAMFPLNGYPIIHWQLAEKVEAGITKNVIVVPPNDVLAKNIHDYFVHDENLYAKWESQGMAEDSASVRNLIESAGVVPIEQQEGRGYGTGVAVEEVIWHRTDEKDNFFEVSYGDDLFVSPRNERSQLANLTSKFKNLGEAVVTIMPVARAQAHRYGVPVLGEEVEHGVYEIKAIEEKPDEPKSRYAQFGSYILKFAIFDYIRQLRSQTDEGEIVLATAVSNFAEENKLYGVVYEGRRFDTGTNEDYEKTRDSYKRLGIRPAL